ncbi:MAG: phenylalanine--tRNA ligase subunit beta [Wigglesworthia glossinidia]|nr:phenylalanine--tRNA ligase subunit beta [Wigglesworthia glossinidia]
MKCSLSWLKEWIKNSNIKFNKFIDKIQKVGFEVEKIVPIDTKFFGVKVGEVIYCETHPNNKLLNIFSINIGNMHIIKVISNHKKDLLYKKIAVAMHGSKLENKTIKAKILFGKESDGIFCSYKDLKIFNTQAKSKKIVILPKNTPAGKDIKKYFLLKDVILHINITPNRFDCLNLIGLSRAIKSENDNIVFKRERLKKILPTNNIQISIEVKAPEACPKYLNRIIKNVKINIKTPIWIIERLKRSGYISKNNILIDIIYYVFIETGQPIKIFDMNKISRNLIIRYTNRDEYIKISKEKKIFLDEKTLVVSDQNTILELAGLLINNDVKINLDTTDIVISSAFYHGKLIYDLANKYNIHSEFTEKYIKNMVDPDIQLLAIERITELVVHCCHGSPGPINSIIFKKFLPKHKTIILNKNKIKNILGFCINKNKIENILYALKYKLKYQQNSWHITPPSWRIFNVKNEADIINDIACLYEFENIPLKLNISGLNQKTYCKHTELDRIKYLLIDRGYQEIITYTFVDQNIQKILYPKKTAISILNPIVDDMSVLRLSLWTNFIKTILYNQSRQISHVRIFESGFCFIPNKNYTFGIHQKFMIAGAVSENSIMHWKLKKEKLDFYDIKGDIEALIQINHDIELLKFKTYKDSALNSGKSAKIYLENKCIGLIGEINPFLKKQFKLKNSIFLFELSWKLISNNYIPKIVNISDLPYSQRDISMIIHHNIPVLNIIEECKNIIKNKLIDIKIFDLYQGDEIKNGFKSISLRLILQDKNTTLTNKKINIILEKCITILKNKFKVEIRGISST